MARQRTAPNNNNEQENKVSDFFTVLDDEEAAKELEGARLRGQYKPILEAFAEANVRTVKLNLDGKKAPTVKQGLMTAKKAEGAPDSFKSIEIITRKDNVYLRNNSVSASA